MKRKSGTGTKEPHIKKKTEQTERDSELREVLSG